MCKHWLGFGVGLGLVTLQAPPCAVLTLLTTLLTPPGLGLGLGSAHLLVQALAQRDLPISQRGDRRGGEGAWLGLGLGLGLGGGEGACQG